MCPPGLGCLVLSVLSRGHSAPVELIVVLQARQSTGKHVWLYACPCAQLPSCNTVCMYACLVCYCYNSEILTRARSSHEKSLSYISTCISAPEVPSPPMAALPAKFKGRPHAYVEFLNGGLLPYHDWGESSQMSTHGIRNTTDLGSHEQHQCRFLQCRYAQHHMTSSQMGLLG